MRKRINLSLTVALLCAFTFLTACNSDQSAQQASQLPPTEVTAIAIQPQTFPIMSEYMGQTMGYLSVEVRAQITGILLTRHYTEGEYVEKGQLLFEIDPSQAQAALDQAQAALAQAQSSLDNAQTENERIASLYARNAVSQRDRDNAQTAFQTAQANVEAERAAVNEAQIMLGYTHVTAPISGFTSLDARNEGSLITADAQGSLLTVINQIDPMYVKFSFPGTVITRLGRLQDMGQATISDIGTSATITMMDGEAYGHTGTLSEIDTQVNPLTNAIEARAEFPNPDNLLIPNMYTSISFKAAELIDAMVLPQSSILYTANGTMVYVVGEDNTVSLKAVTLGDPIEDLFLISDGLTEGDVVVLEGISKIHPGAEVHVNYVDYPTEEIAEHATSANASNASDNANAQ